MVTKKDKKKKESIERSDTTIRMSRWLDSAIENYISDKRAKIEFPNKRNFVDRAVMHFFESRKISLEKEDG
jgi:hypothetical protein